MINSQTSKFIVGGGFFAKIEQSNFPRKSFDIVFAADVGKRMIRGFESKADARARLLELMDQELSGEA